MKIDALIVDQNGSGSVFGLVKDCASRCAPCWQQSVSYSSRWGALC